MYCNDLWVPRVSLVVVKHFEYLGIRLPVNKWLILQNIIIYTCGALPANFFIKISQLIYLSYKWTKCN